MDLISPKGSHVQALGTLAEKLLRKGYARADGASTVPVVEEREAETTPEEKPAEATPTSGEPRGNASTEAWADYASGIGVEFPEDANRKQIQEAIVAAGK